MGPTTFGKKCKEINKSHWSKGTSNHTQLRMAVFMLKLKDINWFFPALLPIKESFNLTGWDIQQTKPNQKVVISGVTLPWWLSLCKKIRSLDFFNRYWWSKGPVWLDEGQNWPYPTKRGSLTCYLPLMIISRQKT